MRLFLISVLLLASAPAMAACPALLDRKVETIEEKSQSLCEYQGKVLLVVNTASQCGYTPQYEGPRGALPQVRPARAGGARLSFQRFRRPGARLEQGDRELLRQPVRRRFPGIRKDRPQRPRFLHQPGKGHRQGAAVELPQISRRPRRQRGA